MIFMLWDFLLSRISWYYVFYHPEIHLHYNKPLNWNIKKADRRPILTLYMEVFDILISFTESSFDMYLMIYLQITCYFLYIVHITMIIKHLAGRSIWSE